MCEICYEYPDEADMQGLGTCDHRFCLGCITDYLNFVVTNGQVQQIKCASQGCPCEYTRDDIRKFGSKEIFAKYLRFKENIDVNLNPNMKWCPRPDCTHYVEKGPKKRVKCQCGFEICFTCGQQWHGRIKCSAAVDSGFKDWASSNRNVKNCPKCKARIEKNGGCNHMTCQSCRYQWCWICGNKYSGKHYKYYNPFSCIGEQYDDSGKCMLLLKALLRFIMFPFILLFGPMVYLPA